MNQLPPRAVIFNLINAHIVARCMHVIADVGVADALGDDPASAEELASATGMNADALGRILRLLASQGVFAEEGSGYVHTPVSALLRTDHPQSLRSSARMMGLPVIWNEVTQLRYAVETGRPALDYAGVVDYFSRHPEESCVFDEAMAGRAAAMIPLVTGAYDFSPFPVIADIGGGRGHLLQAILQSAPQSSGVLFDLPHVIAGGGIASDRLRLVAGDFFRDALPAADAYVLMEVIHDWADEDAVRILTAIRRAAPAHARVLIVEALIPEAPGPQDAKLLDIVMLVVTGGRERTPTQYAALFEASGLRLETVRPTPSPYSIVEARIA